MHITLFGGSFDPPHLAHQRVVEYLLEQKLTDEVWYVPVKQHPFGKKLTADEHRLAMLRLLTQSSAAHQPIKIETYELDHPTMSYTYNTLEYFAAKQQQHTFSWLIGSDNIAAFPKWYHATELLQKYQVFVYPRANFPLSSLLPGMVSLEKAPEVHVSSTDVRAKIAAGEPITALVSKEVEAYIFTHHLYVPYSS